MRRECASCLFFYPTRTAAEMASGANAVEGECRRHPPVPDRKNDCIGNWPTVMFYDWCGEHRPGTYRERGFQ